MIERIVSMLEKIESMIGSSVIILTKSSEVYHGTICYFDSEKGIAVLEKVKQLTVIRDRLAAHYDVASYVVSIAKNNNLPSLPGLNFIWSAFIEKAVIFNVDGIFLCS